MPKNTIIINKNNLIVLHPGSEGEPILNLRYSLTTAKFLITDFTTYGIINKISDNRSYKLSGGIDKIIVATDNLELTTSREGYSFTFSNIDIDISRDGKVSLIDFDINFPPANII